MGGAVESAQPSKTGRHTIRRRWCGRQCIPTGSSHRLWVGSLSGPGRSNYHDDVVWLLLSASLSSVVKVRSQEPYKSPAAAKPKEGVTSTDREWRKHNDIDCRTPRPTAQLEVSQVCTSRHGLSRRQHLLDPVGHRSLASGSVHQNGRISRRRCALFRVRDLPDRFCRT